MIIRRMLQGDLRQVCEIEQETSTEPWLYIDFFKAMTNKNNIYLVAEDNGSSAPCFSQTIWLY